MTTIIGIKTNAGEEGIVLAADTQLNMYKEGKNTGKKYFSKLRVGELYAIAFEGTVDKYVEAFFNYLAGKRDFMSFIKFLANSKKESDQQSLVETIQFPKELAEHVQKLVDKTVKPSNMERVLLKYVSDATQPTTKLESFFTKVLQSIADIKQDPIGEAIKTKYFAEVALLNRFYSKREEDTVDATSLILATQEPLGLYRVDSYGNVIESSGSDGLEYFCSGGAEAAEKYFDEEQYDDDPTIPMKISLDNITIPIALRLAVSAIKKQGAEDVDTNSFVDRAVVTKEHIKLYRIKRVVEKAADRDYEETENKYAAVKTDTARSGSN